jgi:non-specific protein-tyrosine kinase
MVKKAHPAWIGGARSVDLRRQLRIVRSRFVLIVLVTVIAAGIGFGVATLMPRVYEGRATILIGQSLSAVHPDFKQLETSQRLTVTYASLATRRPILQSVIDTLGLETTPEDLAQTVHAEPSQTTAFLTIVARSADPAKAAAIANEVAERLIAASPTVSGQQVDLLEAVQEDLKNTRSDIDAATAEVERLQAIDNPTPEERASLLAIQNRLASLRSTYASLLSFSSTNGANLLTVVEPAVAPTDPSSPGRSLYTALAGILGFFLVLAVIFILEYLDDALRRPEEVEEALGLPTLGSIGRLRGDSSAHEMYSLVTLMNPRSPAAETYRSIRANLDFSSIDAPVRTLLVTSAGRSEGKTVTSANLAVVFAQAGRRTLLVDADLRLPGADRIFRLENEAGYTTLVLNPNRDHATVIQTTEQEGLAVLTSGPLPPNPAEFLGSHRGGAVLRALADAYDVVVIDSPPLQAVADGAILSQLADATVLVVDARRSHRESVIRARETLERAGARVIGVVLNRVPRELDADPYGAQGKGYGTELDARATSRNA